MAVNKTHVISLRLTEKDYQPFAEVIEQAQIRRSHFFRTLLLSKADRINITPKSEESPDYKRWLFYINKTSNNINQIARRLNVDHKAGILNHNTYKLCLSNLITIKNILEGVVNNDSKIRGRE